MPNYSANIQKSEIINLPATQPVSGTVAVSSIPEVEVKNDTGNPLKVIGQSGAFTSRSGVTSATINTGTQMAAALSTRKFLLIQNVGAADIWVGFGVAAATNQPCVKLSPGVMIRFDMDTYVPNGVINVISATASVPFTCYEA